VLSGKAANINSIVFGFTRLGISPTIYVASPLTITPPINFLLVLIVIRLYQNGSVEIYVTEKCSYLIKWQLSRSI